MLTICFGLSACGSSERENSRNETNSSSSQSKESYVGRYISWKDDAGIKLNSDGTGRYVYYDKVNTHRDMSIIAHTFLFFLLPMILIFNFW